MFRPVLVIPLFNHYEQFRAFLPHLGKSNLPMIVIDDGGGATVSQKLQDLCKDNDITYMRLDKNSGKGAAVITGMRLAQKMGFTHAIQIDADGQHDVDDLPKFIARAKENPHAIICGMPLYSSDAPRARVNGRKIANLWVRIETFGAVNSDTMCGFRLYPLSDILPVLKKLRFMRMGFDIEVLVRASWRGLKTIGQETKIIYPRDGFSNYRMLRDNIKISLLHIYLCSLLPLVLINKCLRKIK